MSSLLNKFFPSASQRTLKKLSPLRDAINAQAERFRKLSDDELRAWTPQLRERLERGASVDDRGLMIDAFAVCREAAWRVLGMRPYDVQLIGGLALHQGRIAEMKTGEGKTLVATMPTYLNALTGRGVHVVTVNDYLARRDAEWMGQLYRWLGLSTGVIVNSISDQGRQEAYRCDITYGQNNEFGFDYLRDNMKFRLEDYVQRELNFAIIDEVDSILIDEARTPLIISGPTENANELYITIDRLIPKLRKDIHYNVNEKSHSATLTEAGVDRIEEALGIDNLYAIDNIVILHHVNNALKAHTLYRRDVNYLVRGGEVVIIDEHTGRLMDGRRWSDGLHQAVEAKEGVSIQAENQTLATISFQNYFRLYNKLSGMTGTAKTEEAEFQKIYSLDVLEVPTNKEILRLDEPDLVYRTERGKFLACVEEIRARHEQGQPVLVGTTSVEKSEIIHRLLQREKIPHEVLNAKYHRQEASIVAQAGRLGRVTVATNMAGRGTDIILGGNAEYWGQALLEEQGVAVRYTSEWEKVEDFVKQICLGREDEARAIRSREELLSEVTDETIQRIAETRDLFAKEQEGVLAAGGLFILGTERHESRRIDNQLRGRAGRQGDPGGSRFYLSLEDTLMRLFAKDAVVGLMDRVGMNDDLPIESPMVSRAIERAQRQVEGQHFDHRKHLLEYDDVMNLQRKSIYGWRRQILEADEAGLEEITLDAMEDIVVAAVDRHCNGRVSSDRWEPELATAEIAKIFGLEVTLEGLHRSQELYQRRLYFGVEAPYKERRDNFNSHEDEMMAKLQRQFFLQYIDEYWKQHLLTMEQLRTGIGLRGYGQRDPKKEYQREGYELFQALILEIKSATVRTLFHVQLKSEEERLAEEEAYRRHLEERERQLRMIEEQTRASAAKGEQQKEKGGETRPARGRRRAPGKELLEPEQRAAPIQRERPRIGRNDPCHCGSGKKYKHCHWKIDNG